MLMSSTYEHIKYKECSVNVYYKRTFQRTFNIQPKNSFYLEGSIYDELATN